MRRAALLLIAGLLSALVLLGHLGALHPIGDTVAVAGPLLSAFGLVAGLLIRGRVGWALAAGFGAWLAVWSWQTFAPDGPPGDFVIYQKNLWYRNTELLKLAQDIEMSGADVVALQEVSDRNAGILSLLAASHPYQHRCDYSSWSDLAVLSRHPFVAGSTACSRNRSMASAVIDRAGEQVSVASIHLPWPYPYIQADWLRRIEPHLSALPRPVVIGGDLNMFPQTRVSRLVARLTGTRELRQLKPTLWLRGVPMYLDHVLAPGGRVERRPLMGSDHYGLLGRVRLQR